ncbi:Metal-dependent hydrolases of the beta-lactamase superfamily III [Thioalkalivibrio nitratireducens DSM 14787]|uniref:Metal-dependent hydrolases of the beta-lactamase superfamily III n=1 Tax=Thioalkalivibrio nitratireducens (strain DSM 14787 / UNIQEM 213 / ALEN2) TaxID=1255043 RepID=L0DVD0_THIND|nr:metal-dependent hydrolase [Thioalkalivibrio nitratireducens]AGA32930.1 Metal-dependent hydrolases of the beta-lactamase superfamily III [Thioalkalivibrio nitratireducens DSM 14787]
MKPQFQTHLVNGTTGDPVLYVDFLFQRRALLFDLGEIVALSPRQVLRVTDVFVSHTHMDHFIGFDTMLRLMLGRSKRLRLFGPPDFLDRVAHRLLGYTWNLVHNFAVELVIEAVERWPDGELRRARFRSSRAFAREEMPPATASDGVLLDEDDFRVRAVPLDHNGIVSLAFALEEKAHLNVWKNRLDELGLPTGPWLTELKRRVRRGDADDTALTIRWRDRHGEHQRIEPLGLLRREVLREVPGQTIAYVVDAVFHDANRRAIVQLARYADRFYVEAPFLNEAATRAATTGHLTAGQAGRLAREAGVKRLIPFHFSSRHTGQEALIEEQAMTAFAGGKA